MVQRRPFNKLGGTIFPPPGSREGGARVDFRADVPFANQIEWHGVRWAWSRMTICPCKGINGQTDQVDPNCSQCNALGWRPIQTPGYFLDPEKVGKFTEAQTALISRYKAMVIRGIPTSMTSQPNMFAALGNWGLGSVLITVRPENKIGYYDRLTHLDDVIPFSELLTADGSDNLKLRYPAEAINGLISDTQTYGDADVVLSNGNVTWLPGKAPLQGTQLSINYLYHPVFVVIEYAHLLRFIHFRKKPPTTDVTPMGDAMQLPLQVVARLEHLPLEAHS